MIKDFIAEKLRDARIDAGLSQKRAAELLHIHPSTLGKKESGDRPVYAAELILFAELYQQPVDYFFAS